MDVRLDRDDLDALARTRGHTTRSAAIRELIRLAAEHADALPEHAPLERDDVLRALERRIRDGSVPAARAWLAEHWKDQEQAEPALDPFAAFDDLDRLRARREERLHG